MASALGRAWRETDEDATDRETLILNLLSGEYKNPVRIVAFNTAERWSRVVTVAIADELRRRYVEYDEVPEAVLEKPINPADRRPDHVRRAMGLWRLWTISHDRLDHSRHRGCGRGRLAPTIRLSLFS